MSDNNAAAGSSNLAKPEEYHGPSERSGVRENPNLNTTSVELYKLDQKVYVKGRRGVDPKPYEIAEVLGEGQYKLRRDGKKDKQVYKDEDLQGVPPGNEQDRK